MQITREQAYEKIAKLVDRFHEHITEYKRNKYNEHQTRVDYINPLFKALGWDMDNEQGYAEAYREVIHEDKVKVGSSTKAPDYGFTLFGQRKFFVDAKKPSINIKGDIAPAYQIRRYGWSAKVPISIVTDFEEFSIYDCTKKPKPTDKASVSRIKYITYDQYLNEFDFLWDVFAKENLPKGRFDKYVQSDTRKKGTATVDDEFLKSIEEWRRYLATTIALRNKTLTEDEVNYAVQKIIDRIIFLRMCEDRGVEQYGELKKAIEKGDIYQNLFALYRTADDKYNSGLFDFKEDKITPTLIVDNKVMKNIIKELYYPNCEYEFSVMPADILGSVYERFLGKTIRLTKAHHAKIEEKPEVRKAGGVYYTPKYVVDYIVENTVGKLIDGKTPNQVEKIKICDPACGSGSFLIGAYRFLLEWHLKYYMDNPPKKKKDNPLTPDGNLTTAKKKRILLNSIFGVDIDTQAVEVTKLNLLLKALECETQSSIKQQMTLFHERVLPNLGNNIKCGNSLIGHDFYDEQLDLFPEQLKKVNAFDWEEGFPAIFKEGGFDAVIGNPPYFSLDIVNDEQKNYYKKTYSSFATRQSNIYFFFIAKSHYILKDDGLLSFINERYYFNSKNAEKFRKFVLNNYKIEQILDFQNIQIFKGVNTLTVINTFKKTKRRGNIKVIQFKQEVRKLDEHKILESSFYKSFDVNQKNILENDWTFNDSKLTKIQTKLDKYVPLDELVKMGQGIKSGLNKVFIVNEATIKEYKLEKEILRKYIKTRDIQKYQIHFRDLYLILALNESDINEFPNTKNYLSQFKKELEERYQFKDGVCKWYSLSIPQNLNILQDNKEKIFTPLYSKGNKFGFDSGDKNGDYYILTDAFVLAKKKEIDMKYLLALLNSSLLDFFNSKFGKLKRDGYYEYSRNTLSRFPIKVIETKEEIQKRIDIIKFVENILKITQQLQAMKLETERQQIQRAIDHAKNKIDELVYGLYGLNKKEIKIIENH